MDSARPAVSCVIAAYNVERYVGRAIDSVLAQDFPQDQIEIVVVDDGSTDGTAEVLAGYGDRLRVIRQPNGGNLAAYTTGIGAATGRYLALLDGDDEWLPGKLRAQHDVLESRPEVGLVHSDMRVVDAQGNVLEESWLTVRRYEPVAGAILGRLLRGNVVTTSALMVRADLRDRFHPLPSWSRVQDWWISCRVAEVAEIACLAEPLVLYRQHGANLNLGRSDAHKLKLVRREIVLRRWLLSEADTAGVHAADLVQALTALNDAVERVADGLSVRTAELLPVTRRQRSQARARRGAAEVARRERDLPGVVRHAVAAMALDPTDPVAGRLLGPAVKELRARELAAEAERAVFRFEGARGLATLADAAELVERPELLAAYAATFGAADDATLVIRLGADDGELDALQAAVSAAGLDADDAADLLAVPAADTPAEVVAGGVQAVLSAHLPDGPLAAVPSIDAAGIDALGALARRARGGAGVPTFCITICAPHWRAAPSWGDLHFARAIQQELHRRGMPCAIRTIDEWASARAAEHDVVLHLRGLHEFAGDPRQLNVLWCISHPDLLTDDECDRSDLVFTVSESFAAGLAERTATPVHVLEQATDPAVFFPEYDAAHARDLVFVGNSRAVRRPVIADLVPTEHDLAIWGDGWAPFVPPRLVAGRYLPNAGVRRAYHSAAIVLNDHWGDMREHGFLSNRLYDAVAAGGFVISDDVAQAEERFGGAVVTYRTADELHALVEHYLAHPEERAERSRAGRELVIARHTFAHRVDTLLAHVEPALAERRAAPARRPALRR